MDMCVGNICVTYMYNILSPASTSESQASVTRPGAEDSPVVMPLAHLYFV